MPLADLEVAEGPNVLGDLCRSVLEVGVEHEHLLTSGAYAQLAAAGKVPGLLSAVGALSALGEPDILPARSRSWATMRAKALPRTSRDERGVTSTVRSFPGDSRAWSTVWPGCCGKWPSTSKASTPA